MRIVDAFVEQLDLRGLGFAGVDPKATGRPSYHPAILLKLYIYGYLNRIQSSRCLEREAQRNIELMWLLGRLSPDFKTIADFRRDNGTGIRNVCRQFVVLCRELNLFALEFGLPALCTQGALYAQLIPSSDKRRARRRAGRDAETAGYPGRNDEAAPPDD